MSVTRYGHYKIRPVMSVTRYGHYKIRPVMSVTHYRHYKIRPVMSVTCYGIVTDSQGDMPENMGKICNKPIPSPISPNGSLGTPKKI